MSTAPSSAAIDKAAILTGVPLVTRSRRLSEGTSGCALSPWAQRLRPQCRQLLLTFSFLQGTWVPLFCTRPVSMSLSYAHFHLLDLERSSHNTKRRSKVKLRPPVGPDKPRYNEAEVRVRAQPWSFKDLTMPFPPLKAPFSRAPEASNPSSMWMSFLLLFLQPCPQASNFPTLLGWCLGLAELSVCGCGQSSSRSRLLSAG